MLNSQDNNLDMVLDTAGLAQNLANADSLHVQVSELSDLQWHYTGLQAGLCLARSGSDFWDGATTSKIRMIVGE